ncbi:protein rapunzel-like isoform X2 [Conger conger]|uniref:protein rapunzel-like isoform X2 n=1 Tax=Conger conger TaxID=82655 RepID=UPI002A5AF1B5|nr:protein rapunzel-like isoform X2 [Conger conger]
MADQLQKFIAEKKDLVDAVMDMFEKGAEVLASITGELFPIFSVVAPVVRLAMDNVESKEAEYMKKQFQKVRERLEVVSEEIRQVDQEIKNSRVDAAYLYAERNLSNQFRKFMDILNAKPKFREVKKKLFLEQFSRNGGDKNLHTLYDAVMGGKSSGESVLEITLNYHEKSRRVMEDFCARLKNLFCIGLIALVGQAALKGAGEEEDVLKDWGERMKEVQGKMDAVIQDCINSYPQQAQIDTRKLVSDDEGAKTSKELADSILEALGRKYDWVRWSVRVYLPPSGMFSNKKDYNCAVGKSQFQVQESEGKLAVAVSYSASPEPLDKPEIQQRLAGQKKQTPKEVAQMLFEQVPICSIHVISTDAKDLAFACNFADELHFWEVHKKLHVCVHSA